MKLGHLRDTVSKMSAMLAGLERKVTQNEQRPKEVSKMSAILAGLERKVTQLSLQQQNRTATEGGMLLINDYTDTHILSDSGMSLKKIAK